MSRLPAWELGPVFLFILNRIAKVEVKRWAPVLSVIEFNIEFHTYCTVKNHNSLNLIMKMAGRSQYTHLQDMGSDCWHKVESDVRLVKKKP
jgi:hypothetical protein